MAGWLQGWLERGRVEGIEQGRVEGIEQGRHEERALLCRQASEVRIVTTEQRGVRATAAQLHSSATTAVRSSVRCAALMGVRPPTGAGSVQRGAARPSAA